MHTPLPSNAHHHQHCPQHCPQHSRRRLFTIDVPSRNSRRRPFTVYMPSRGAAASASALAALAAAVMGYIPAEMAAGSAGYTVLTMLVADCLRRE